MRADTAEDAFGRCLSLSLELGVVALQERPDVQLVVWHVTNDCNFLDHWALLVGEREVIDVTRVQVDGRTDLLHDIADYPVNFRTPSRYPAAPLVAQYIKCESHQGDRFSPGFIWKFRGLIFRHDVGQALRGMHLRQAARAVGAFCKFAWVYSLGRLLEHMQTRQRTLLGGDCLTQEKSGP